VTGAPPSDDQARERVAELERLLAELLAALNPVIIFGPQSIAVWSARIARALQDSKTIQKN
jgi:hypothetical protein